jgi:hypothetical protein
MLNVVIPGAVMVSYGSPSCHYYTGSIQRPEQEPLVLIVSLVYNFEITTGIFGELYLIYGVLLIATEYVNHKTPNATSFDRKPFDRQTFCRLSFKSTQPNDKVRVVAII